MPRKLVIDMDILGWGDVNEKKLHIQYDELLEVSKHPDLVQRSFDNQIAAYCLKNGCDLMTGDAKSYTHFFDAGVKSLRITRYDWWKIADKPIYLVQIVD